MNFLLHAKFEIAPKMLLIKLLFSVLFIFSWTLTSTWGQETIGQIRFQQCVPCHQEDANGKISIEAPSIAGLPVWYFEKQFFSFKKGERGKHPDDIRGFRMRAMSKTIRDKEVRSVAEYVFSLPYRIKNPVVVGNIEAGKERYQYCAACHGADALGNEVLGAPPLVKFDDSYIYTQVMGFKNGLLGSSIAGSTSNTMAMAIQQGNVTEEDIRNIAAYIRHIQENPSN